MPMSLSSYFYKRRSFAYGCASAGGGMGGLIIPILVATLLKFFDLNVVFLALGSLGKSLKRKNKVTMYTVQPLAMSQ